MQNSCRKIVLILGATGTGKSKLAIALAKRFNGEIISTDSMQIYRGLDIITNKVTAEEAQGIPHHMMSFVDPMSISFHVQHFRKRALEIVEEIFSRQKIPILVGGTNYYMEATLWDFLIEETKLGGPSELFTDGIPTEYLKISNFELHEKLREIDPEMASRLHPNTRAKIYRSLQIWHRTGKKQSELLKEQHERGKNSTSGFLRFKDSIALWLICEPATLEKRLDERQALF